MKESNNSRVSTSSIGFSSLLTIVFIVLKLIGKISWSWLWVLSPLWISTAIYIFVFIIVLIIALIVNE